MAYRISDLDPLGSGLKKNDKLEMVKTDEGKSYSCTPEDILNYCKDHTNGSFRGTTSESLDNLGINAIGVWQWTGSGGPNNVTQGILEIISDYSAEDTTGQPNLIQRLTSEMFTYQRSMENGEWKAWLSLANINGCRVRYGLATTGNNGEVHVDFIPSGPDAGTAYFSGTPVVTATVENSSSETIYLVNINNVTNAGFDIVVKGSNFNDHFVKQTVETEEDEQVTTTRTVTIETQGQWFNASSIKVHWCAMREEG